MFRSKPSISRFVLVCLIVYVSGYGLISVTGNLYPGYIVSQIFWLFCFSFVFSYGIMSIYRDVKEGIIGRIYRKIKEDLE